MSRVLWMVLRKIPHSAGNWRGGGIPLTLAARLVQAELFGLRSSDPVTLMAAVLVIAVVTMLAACIPARRAAKVDPMVALRY